MSITHRLTTMVALACLLIGTGTTPAQSPTPADKLIVHEWGTFTSVQGSDGIALEGLQHEEERLPSFVYSRTKVRECPLREYGYKGLEVPVTHVTQKMETPVIYFHTSRPTTLGVRVEFVKGLLTQWYPVSDLLGPPEGSVQQGPLDLKSIDRSFLEWKIDLDPTPSPGLGGNPVEATNPWSFARAVDAAVVRTLPRKAPERKGPVESEKFIFYRGLGTFALPVVVESAAGGHVLVRNGGKLALPFAFALEMKGETGRFEPIGELAGGAEKRIDLRASPEAPKDAVVTGLKGAVSDALVASGLYKDEAEAMVKTWSRAWFASEGTRIIYSVPRSEVDALLPLTIKPTPDETIRVLVGRIEFMTPETEAVVEAALRNRSSPDAATRDEAMGRLVKFDRFLEPHLRRLIAKTGDAGVRKSGEELLATLKN